MYVNAYKNMIIREVLIYEEKLYESSSGNMRTVTCT